MTSSTTIGTKTGRARRRISQLWQAPTFLIGLCALIGVAASTPWRPTPEVREFEQIVATLRVDLEQRDADVDRLATLADDLLLRVHALPQRRGDVHFLAGSAFYRQAQQKPPQYAREIWPRAIDHLEQAVVLTDGADRVAAQYRLGYSLYQQRKDIPRAIELMTLAVDKGAEQPIEGYRLLVDANLKLAKPNLSAALSASSRVLELTPERDLEAVAHARVQHAELLMRMEMRADAIRELTRVSAKVSRPLRVKARLLQARACKEEGLWSQALPLWQELLKDEAQVDGGRAYINYEMGWCFHEMKPPNYAENIRVWSEALLLGGPAGQAAGLYLGELRFSLDERQAPQALADWKQALAKVRTPDDFKNPYIEIAQVREILEGAIKEFLELQDPEKTQAVGELYRKVKAGGADQRLAEAAESYALLLAERAKEKDSPVTAEQVLAQYRRAGEAFENAAGMARGPDGPELLWRAARCYRAAKDIPRAQQILHQFVLADVSETRQAEGWYTLGDIYRAEGKQADAHKAFVKCIEYPNTPFYSRSLYYLAVEEIDKKSYEKAHSILTQILSGTDKEIDRPAHEKSMYKMASLLMLMQNFDEAHVYLNNCVNLYPENPSARLARQQLGDCCHRLAARELDKEAEQRNLIKPGIPEDARLRIEESLRKHRSKRRQWLTDAVKNYQILADDLQMTAREQELDSVKATLLRRALFGIGECHLDGEEFRDAITAFEKLQVKHRRTVEGMYACTRICFAVVAMGTSAKDGYKLKTQAMESLKLLLADIKELPQDHEIYKTPGGWTRAGWIRWAETTQLQLLAPPKKDSSLPAFR